MHILVTNDDGIQAAGLAALAGAMRTLGKVTIVAPDHNWSAGGHVKTLHRPLRVKEAQLCDGSSGLACDGAPSDCVALVILGLLQEPVDLVVSGINFGANMGYDLTYSGTVTAVMEAAISGLPGVAISLCRPPTENSTALDYQPAALASIKVVQQLIEHGLPGHTLLNVNVPFLPAEQLRGFQVTRQGQRVYQDRLVTREDPFGKPYYWIGGDPPAGVLEEGTDVGAVNAGFVSVTPVHMDMTAHREIEKISTWDFNGSNTHSL